MTYTCKDAQLLEEMAQEVTEKHGLGYKYSHSVTESDEERKQCPSAFSGPWLGDIHWFSKARRLFTVVKYGMVSSVTARMT